MRLAPLPVLALAACAAQTADDADAGVPVYRGVETRLLDGDLVNFRVSMSGGEGPTEVTRYAECAAARYTLIRGYGFARHVRTQVAEQGGIWSADAVYTISPALPDGVVKIDAEVTVDACELAGIPTV